MIKNDQQFITTRKIEIDAAHRVPDHASKCFQLHGHRYVIEATCVGTLHETGEQTGMCIDFGFLKNVMMEEIHDPCDHGMIIFTGDKVLQYQLQITPYERLPEYLKILWLNCVPTAENLAQYWYDQIYKRVWEVSGHRAELKCIRVYETPNCYAEYPSYG